MDNIKKTVTGGGNEPRVHIMEGTYNIAAAIVRAANARGLEATATGGGCDFIIREFKVESGHDPLVMVLGAAGAESPDTLDEESFVSLKLSEDWSESIEFYFDTAVEALDFMAGFNGSGSTNLGFLGQ